MTQRTLQLTDRIVTDLPPPAADRYLARDTDLPGFFVLVGQRTKTFMVQGDLRIGGSRKSIRLKIGPAGEFTTRKARAIAKELLGQIAMGKDPRKPADEVVAEKQAALTLGDAWVRYRDAHMIRKGRSEKTIDGYRDHVERVFADWKDQALAELGNNPSLVVERHEAISKANGPYMANVSMRTLRAIYNHARKACRTLPADNPVDAVDWNTEHRRDTGMGLKELGPWFAQLSAFDNPLRREFHLLVLLSGSRPEALKSTKPQHVDFRTRTLHIPKPRGGEKKAFDIPLSRPMCKCLIRIIRLGRMVDAPRAAEWLFPSGSASGHMVEHREDRKVLARWGNDLRQTYRTIGQVAGIADLDMHLLMNHSVPGLNAGYITRARLLSDHLRGQQEKISQVILARIPKPADGVTNRVWPKIASRRLIKTIDSCVE